MLRRRLSRLPLAFTLGACVLVGGSGLAGAAPSDAATHGTTVARGVTRAVDGTLADGNETRATRADRANPRIPDLPFVVPVTILTIALAAFGVARGSARRADSTVRLRDSIGRRAPPAHAPA